MIGFPSEFADVQVVGHWSESGSGKFPMGLGIHSTSQSWMILAMQSLDASMSMECWEKLTGSYPPPRKQNTYQYSRLTPMVHSLVERTGKVLRYTSLVAADLRCCSRRLRTGRSHGSCTGSRPKTLEEASGMTLSRLHNMESNRRVWTEIRRNVRHR